MYFDNMVITDTTASGRVLYCTAVDGPLEDLGPLYWFDVAFEKGSNGMWKMIDCALFRLYFDSMDFNKKEFICYNRELYNQLGVIYNLDSPSTADPAANLVFILPTVSVAAIASAFCLMRRRRENVL